MRIEREKANPINKASDNVNSGLYASTIKSLLSKIRVSRDSILEMPTFTSFFVGLEQKTPRIFTRRLYLTCLNRCNVLSRSTELRMHRITVLELRLTN